MFGLARRIDALEQRQGVGIVRWRRVIVEAGENEDEVLDRAGRENGPRGPGEGLIIRRFVGPGELAATREHK